MAVPGAFGSKGKRALVRAFLALLVCGALLGSGAGAAEAQLTWSRAIGIDKVAGVSLSAVSCPAATQCTAIDQFGRVLTFNPASRAMPTPISFASLASPSAVACPSATQCTLVGGGFELTFDPQSPGSPTAVRIETGTASAPASIGAVACPSTTQCTAIDSAVEITFNPASPGAPAAVTIDAGAQVGLTALACPSATQCTAIDGDGKELTFDPTTSAAPRVAQLEASGLPDAIACPLATQCTAVDENGREITFNPAAPGTPTPTSIDSEQINNLLGVACPSATGCAAASQGGHVIAFNPQSPGSASTIVTDPSSGGNEIGQDTGIRAVSCPGSGACSAVDGNGQVLTFPLLGPGTASIARIDQGVQLQAASCPLETQCTAIDDSREVTFDPVAPHNPGPKAIFSDLGIGFGGLSCPVATQCTAVRGTDALTFNPRAPRKPRPKNVDPVSDEGISGVTCLSVSRCTAVDANSQEAFFDPRTGRRIKVKSFLSGGSFFAGTCASESQCTAVDNDGGMRTFVPRTGKSIAAATIDTLVGLNAPSGGSNDNLSAIACPTTTRCVAVDTLGNEVTFNPRSSHSATPKPIDAGNRLQGIACPSPTECVAVDSAGRALFGAPGSGAWTVEPVAAAAVPLEDISCPSTAECVTVDAAGDAFLGAGNSAAELTGWLRSLLVPSGAGASTVRAGRYKLTFAGLFALTLRIRWFGVPHGGRTPVLVASGTATVTRASDAVLRLAPTGQGRQLLAHSAGVRLTATGSLTAGGRTVSAKQAFRLAR